VATRELPDPAWLAFLEKTAAPAPAIEAEPDEEPPHHLRDYLRVLYRHRWLASVCFRVTLGLTVIVTLLTPRLYTASTRLHVARRSPIQLRLQDNVRRSDETDDGGTDAATFAATQIAALQSRDLAERVIRRRRLASNDAFLRPGRERGLRALGDGLPSALRPRGWDASPGAGAPEEAGGVAPVDPRLVDRYMGYLSVRAVRGTDLIDVAFATPSPGLSAFLAAAHTQAYLEANQEAQHGTDAVAREFLTRQLREARQQIGRTQTAVDRFAQEHPRVAADRDQKIVAALIAELSTQATKAEATRTTLESRYRFLALPGTDPLVYFLDRPGIQRLRLMLLDVGAQRAALSQRLGNNHPQLLELARVEAEVGRQLHAEVEQAVAGVRAHYKAARLREERLRRNVARHERAAIARRGLAAQYELLERDAEAAQMLHASLLKQRMETAVNSELVASNVRIIERAEVPRWPSRPTIPLNLAIGMAAGLLLAVAAALARDYFDDSVKSSDEVERLLHLPTLATIPNFAVARRTNLQALGSGLPVRNGHRAVSNGDRPGDRGQELMVVREPRSMVAEAFRSMRTAVLFSSHGGRPTVILVTSGRAAEGKTVASVNLASTLAEVGSRVLLIDADLRYPRCHTMLGVPGDRGLADVLAGEVNLENAIRVLDAPRLCFLPAGPPPPNPAELLGSARMHRMLAELRARFEFVVVDTPPVLPVTDAVVLAREADGVVLVVKGHDSPPELVRRARDRLLLAGASFLGVIVNDVDLGWGDPYFYSYAGYWGRSGGREKGQGLA